jgi:hypothetical protein
MPPKCPHVACICQHCGDTFYRVPSQVGSYCSKPCQYAGYAGDSTARFWSLVQQGDGCWLWLGHTNHLGYGIFPVRGRNVLAHRFAYELQRGPIPIGAHVLHHCDRRACVREDHLFTGSHRDNMAEMVSKSRNPRGERMGNTRLTDADAQRIRELHRQGLRPKQLGTMFGVAPAVIGNIVARRTWKHLP